MCPSPSLMVISPTSKGPSPSPSAPPPPSHLYRFQKCFPSQEGIWEMHAKYPFHCTQHVPSVNANDFRGTASENDKSADCVRFGELPDVVLLNVFRYSHPVERIRSFSNVSRRWNRLIHCAPIWTHVRIPLRKRTQTAARRFLRNIAKNVRHLCLSITNVADGDEADILKILPKIMPKLRALEVHLRELNSTEVKALCSCSPNLQWLGISVDYNWEEDCFEALTEGTSLEGLRELHLRLPCDVQRKHFECLCSWKRNLEVLNVDAQQYERAFTPWELKSLAECSFRESLSGVYVGSDIFGKLPPEIRAFRNLRRLAINVSAREILPLKSLCMLEHLHLGLADEWLDSVQSSFGSPQFDAFRSLFTVFPHSPTLFPARLKYLSIEGNTPYGDHAVDVITANCPRLRSFNVCGLHADESIDYISDSRRISHNGLLTIGKRLKELEHLDISSLSDLRGDSLKDLLDDAKSLLLIILACNSEEGVKVIEKALRGRKTLVAVRGEMEGRLARQTSKVVHSLVLADMLDTEGVCCMNVFDCNDQARNCVKFE